MNKSQRLLQLLKAQGYKQIWFCAQLGIKRDTFHRQMKTGGGISEKYVRKAANILNVIPDEICMTTELCQGLLDDRLGRETEYDLTFWPDL